MPRLVLVTDLHHSRSEPECRGPTYPQEVLAKLHEAGQLARKLRADAIACAGDWFHRKGRATFQESNDLLAVATGWREAGLEVLGIAGNHDVIGHDLASIDSRALGALVHSRALRLLDEAPWEHEDEDGRIRVTGTSYFSGCDSSDDARVRMYGAEPPEGSGTLHVHLAHGALVLRGDFFEDHTKAAELVSLLARAGRLPDVIYCGHMHFPEEPLSIPRPDGRGDVLLLRPGSLARVSRDDLDRIPVATVLATRGRRAVARTASVGKPIEPPGIDPTASVRSGDEREARVREFVQVLAEEAEHFQSLDQEALVRECAVRLGHGEDVVKVALRRVRRFL